MLKCIKYFLIYNLMGKCHKNFELYQVFIHNFLWQNVSILTSILYTWKTLLSKNWFYFFFLIIWHAKIQPSFRIARYWHWFFTYLFFKCFVFFKFNMLDKKAVPIRLKIKTICLTKNLFWLEKKLKQYAWQKSFSEYFLR